MLDEGTHAQFDTFLKKAQWKVLLAMETWAGICSPNTRLFDGGLVAILHLNSFLHVYNLHLI